MIHAPIDSQGHVNSHNSSNVSYKAPVLWKFPPLFKFWILALGNQNIMLSSNLWVTHQTYHSASPELIMYELLLPLISKEGMKIVLRSGLVQIDRFSQRLWIRLRWSLHLRPLLSCHSMPVSIWVWGCSSRYNLNLGDAAQDITWIWGMQLKVKDTITTPFSLYVLTLFAHSYNLTLMVQHNESRGGKCWRSILDYGQIGRTHS